jgi:hypothetical protein
LGHPAGSRLVSLCAVAILLTMGRVATAQTLSVSGNPGLLRVSTAVAGSQPTPVANNTTTYTVTTPAPNRTYKIVARLSTPMPAGITVTATFAAPTGATSLGAVALTNVDQDVVINIPRNTNSTLSITYSLSPNASGGVIALNSRTVTLTLVRTS